MLSANSGTTPATLSVSINRSNLPGGGAIAGTYTGQILFSTANGSVTVPVSVTVGGNNLVQINPLQFSMVQGGGAPTAQVVQALSSNGLSVGIVVSVSAGSGGAWLTTGTGGTSTPYTAVIGVNGNVASNLAAGVYTSEVIFSPGNGQSPVTVPVTLTIVQPSTSSLANLPGALDFVVKSNGGNPASQIIQVADAGTGSLSWAARVTTSDGGQWLSITPTSGTTPTTATVSIDAASLPGGGAIAGTYTGQILFSTANGSVTVPVSVTVGGNNLVQINPLQFSMVQGGGAPTAQVVQALSSNGLSVGIVVSVSAGSGGAWLTTGTGGTSTPYTAVIGVNGNVASNLAAGVYTSEVIFSPGNGQSPVTVPVTLTIVQPSTNSLANLPGALNFVLKLNGGNPASQIIQVADAGTGTVNWATRVTTSDGGNWLRISPTSGTTPTTATVSINASSLPGAGAIAGTYTGQLLFSTAQREASRYR